MVGWTQKVDANVLQAGSAAPAAEIDFIVVLAQQADLSGAIRLGTKLEKGTFVYQRLNEVARQSQPAILRQLNRLGLAAEPFWIANMIRVRGPISAVQMVAERSDVARIHANPRVHFAEPLIEQSSAPPKTDATESIETNISKINAPAVWSLGYAGQGVVIGGTDTGYRWDHAALKNKYRGWNGVAADHNFNWHDAIHGGGGDCGPNSPAPCDDDGHGTHTMGTMVGDDGGSRQIGVAPGAKWIGCRCMDEGAGTPATYTECLQWFIAPTDLNGQNPDPAKAPDVINNSWGCPPEEGCTDVNILRTIIENVRAAGIVVVVSAGNSGPGCSTIDEAPSIYDAAITTAATDNSDAIAYFSSRGTVTADGSGRLKPDLSAPGVGVLSSTRSSANAYGVLSGTSMAAPHVVGTTALILSAHPEMQGQVGAVETLLEQAAVRLTSATTCGGVPGTQIPNTVFGWGRIDALAAVGLSDSDGDGVADWKEILSGTDRNDAQSSLHVTSVLRESGNYTATFATVPSRHYRLERTASLTNPSWATVVGDTMSSGSSLQLTDTTAAGEPQAFYRVVVIP